MNEFAPPSVKKGDLLIAEPYLNDPNFDRGVLLLCEHNPEGSFGFLLNQLTALHLDDVLDESFYQDTPLYVGGPVEKNTLHFIHRRPDLIPEGIPVMEGVYWGGDFEQIKSLLHLNQISNEEIRFFIGYSGWSSGQLESELAVNSWIVGQASADFLFATPSSAFWRETLKNMGGKYRSIAHYPIDPRLN